MSFLVFMLCMIFAIFVGMVLDRLLIKANADGALSKEYEYFSLIFSTKEEVEDVISILKSCMATQEGVLRVYDLYILTNVKSETSEDYIYGWNSVDDFSIQPYGNEWKLKVPKPILLEK